MPLEQCSCCLNRTIEKRGYYEICPICGWEDDEVQNNDPSFWGGANDLSLNLYREVWARQKPYECALCGHKTLSTQGKYEQCEVCGWIDDPIQNENRDYVHGANPMSYLFAHSAWHKRQSFGLLHGRGWAESIDPEQEAYTVDEERKIPLELEPCPCCGYPILLMTGKSEYCTVCEWIDDPAQSADPMLEGGANETSLNQAKAAWIVKEACDNAVEVEEDFTETSIFEIVKTAV